MTEKTSTAVQIAIIGAGPRGLALAEALLDGPLPRPQITLFDPTMDPGAGPNFAPGQSRLNLLNIPLRDLHLPAPPQGGLGGSQAWFADQDQDSFPPRADVGRYLARRWSLLCAQAGLRHDRQLVQRARPDGRGWILSGAGGEIGRFDHLVLAPGQPESAPDPQLARWQEHARAHDLMLLPAYPEAPVQAAAPQWQGRSVAIRGLGLSSLDVIRWLTEGRGGRHQGGRYHRSGQEPARILPFSLDGMPPAPKPASAGIDAGFALQEREKRDFQGAVAQMLELPEAAALALLQSALAGPLARIAPQMAQGFDRWFADFSAGDDPDTQRGPIDGLRAHLNMAQGREAPSMSYLVGQIWRQLQDALRAGYDPAPMPGPAAQALLALDERFKRYSYGPPVLAAQQLLHLIEADLVDLRAVDDPDIELLPEGWVLRDHARTAVVQGMIDAVIPAPELARQGAPLIRDLADQGFLRAAGPGLGLAVRDTGQVIGAKGRPVPGLYLLGRMAIGAVIAADSLHDCFGPLSRRCAAHIRQA